jgi:hypothetical protein
MRANRRTEEIAARDLVVTHDRSVRQIAGQSRGPEQGAEIERAALLGKLRCCPYEVGCFRKQRSYFGPPRTGKKPRGGLNRGREKLREWVAERARELRAAMGFQSGTRACHGLSLAREQRAQEPQVTQFDRAEAPHSGKHHEHYANKAQAQARIRQDHSDG